LLELGAKDAPKATNLYQYTVEMDKDISFIYATPVKELPTDLFQISLTKKGFHSVVGAVAYEQKNKTTVSIMCRSEKPTLAQPLKPIFQQNQFSCPIGFKIIY
jgi:Type IV pilin-like G and H, putative